MTITEQSFGIQPNQPNAGYIRTIWLLRETDVVAVLDPEELPVVSIPMTVSQAGLLVSPGATVTRLQPQARSASFEEPSVFDRAGLLYTPSLQIPIPRPSAALDEYLTRNQSGRWIAFWIDSNGQGWVAGEPANGLRLALSRKQTDINQIHLALTGRSWHPAWRLETTDLNKLFPDSDFDFAFDTSFSS